MEENDKLLLNHEGEEQMVTVSCAECGQSADLRFMRRQTTVNRLI
jgi:hypothetical protein